LSCEVNTLAVRNGNFEARVSFFWCARKSHGSGPIPI
jgi:hypothetical protein